MCIRDRATSLLEGHRGDGPTLTTFLIGPDEARVRCHFEVRAEERHAMAFFGTYLEVTPHSRLVWTNEEGGEGGPVTTVTFEDKGGKTLLVLHELYSSKEALDAAGTGAADAMVETFAQLDELLATLGASVGRS